MKKVLIKIGGSVLEDESKILSICKDIQTLKESGIDVIVVHGGGKFITKCLSEHGKKSIFKDGYRITHESDVEILQMALYLINKKLVKALNIHGIEAIGISGEDAKLFDCCYLDKYSYGYVGAIKEVNKEILDRLTSQNLIPVIATVGITDSFQSVNINADDVASQVALACGIDEVIFLTDQAGVYNADGKIFSQLTLHKMKELINTHVVVDGMKVKLNSIMGILKKLKGSITILDGKFDEVLSKKLLQNQDIGTTCLYFEEGSDAK